MALSDGFQCGLGIRASDHVVVIITPRMGDKALVQGETGLSAF